VFLLFLLPLLLFIFQAVVDNFSLYHLKFAHSTCYEILSIAVLKIFLCISLSCQIILGCDNK
jgi:hypothetical protein